MPQDLLGKQSTRPAPGKGKRVQGTFWGGSYENTPKALANFSPGFEEREPWGSIQYRVLTLKGFANRETPSGFSVYLNCYPRLSLALQPWAEISERLRRIQMNTTQNYLEPFANFV